MDPHRATRWFATVAAGLAVVAILGWLTHSAPLAAGGLRFVPMAPSTVLCLLLLAAGLIEGTREARPRVMLLLAAIPTAVALLAIARISLGFDPGIEGALTPRGMPQIGIRLGVMSPYTAVLILLLGAGLAATGARPASRLAGWVMALTAGAAAWAAFAALLGYVYGAPLLYGGRHVPIALTTALALFALACGGIMLVATRISALRFFTGDTVSARLSRVLLPLMLGLFVVGEWLHDAAERTFGPDQTVLSALMILWMFGASAGVLWAVIRRTARDLQAVHDDLRASEQQYRALYADSPDALTTLTPDEGFVAGNPAAIRLFACRNADDFVGRSPVSLSPELQPDGRTSAENWKDMLRLALQNGSHVFDWTHRRADGGEFLAKVLLSRLEIGGRSLMQATVRDVTERQRVLTLARDAETLEAVSQLAGGIAHELNNKMSTVLLYSDSVLAGLPCDSPIREDLGEIHRAGARAAALVHRLLAFAQRQALTVETVGLNRLIIKAGQEIAEAIRPGVELSMTLDPRLGDVQVDPRQVQEVLLCLVRNASDAMPHGGTLSIRTETAEIDDDTCATVPDAHPGRHVSIAVQDSGVGMTREVMNRLFKPFFTTKGLQSTGLALQAARGIVRQSGGWMTVCSERGHGSTFTIFLPQALRMWTPHAFAPTVLP